MHTLIVTERAAGERLDVFVTAASGLSRSQVQQLVRQGTVTVDGGVKPARFLVQTGQTITYEVPEAAPAPTFSAPDLPVLYEDDDVVVVDKPAGLTVHAGAGTSGQATVADFARTRSSDPDPDRPGIVHRLDRDTSGVLVIAKHTSAKLFLQTALKNREVAKTYVALVVGRPKPETATIDLPLGRDLANPLRQAVIASGRPSSTNYHITAVYAGYSLLSLVPRTGRTHQIRVHLAAIGHAIAGDTLYGAPTRPAGLPRHFLHASRLELMLPSGEPLIVESPLPPDLESYLSKLAHSV